MTRYTERRFQIPHKRGLEVVPVRVFYFPIRSFFLLVYSPTNDDERDLAHIIFEHFMVRPRWPCDAFRFGLFWRPFDSARLSISAGQRSLVAVPFSFLVET